MKKYLFLFLFFISTSLSAQQLKSTGVIIGAGGGRIASELSSTNAGLSIDKNRSSLDRSGVFELGYRFRFAPAQKRFFYDVDFLAGYSKTSSEVNFLSDGQTVYSGNLMDQRDFSIGIGGTFNWTLIKGLNVGVGLQPTVYIWEAADKVFDIPVVAKVGYDFGFLELAFSYKQGLTKGYKIFAYENGRLSNWQFSLYIPLSKHQKK